MSIDIIGGFASDILSSLGYSGAGTASAFGVVALKRLLAKRMEHGRSIFLEEMRRGRERSEDIPEDEMAAVVFRYMRATVEGSARLNLRLLAATASGQAADVGLYADEFLRWADLIASLSREEIVLLGEWHAFSMANAPFQSKASVWTDFLPVLEAKRGIGRSEADMIAAACLRTGLVRLLGGLMDIGHAYLPTPRLETFMQLADIEGVLQRDAAAST